VSRMRTLSRHVPTMDFTLLTGLPASDIKHLKNAAKQVQGIENYWVNKVGDALQALTHGVIESLLQDEPLKDLGLEDLFVEHYFDVCFRGLKIAMGDQEPKISHLQVNQQFAKYPVAKLPNSLKGLMRLYDKWKRGKYTPQRPKKQAQAIQKKYLKKVASVWEKHSKAFRAGDVAVQDLVVTQIREAADTTSSRAKTIVRTETTNYYNNVRKDYYDQSKDITHYLFIAIRDAGTSPWCTPLTINGLRGRSGLVYSKDDPLLKEEMPACHYGCRSEIVPLNRLNPAHLRYIQNEKIQRRNVKCFPLLKGWSSAG
jgi:SPP1 gp7 family putative phage head morphogenesis protein